MDLKNLKDLNDKIIKAETHMHAISSQLDTLAKKLDTKSSHGEMVAFLAGIIFSVFIILLIVFFTVWKV